MSTIQVRTNEKIKKAAQAVLAKLGLDLSTAINLYLVQIVEKKGIPFRIFLGSGNRTKKKAKYLGQ